MFSFINFFNIMPCNFLLDLCKNSKVFENLGETSFWRIISISENLCLGSKNILFSNKKRTYIQWISKLWWDMWAVKYNESNWAWDRWRKVRQVSAMAEGLILGKYLLIIGFSPTLSIKVEVYPLSNKVYHSFDRWNWFTGS